MFGMTRHAYISFGKILRMTSFNRMPKGDTLCRCQQIQGISTTNSLWKKRKASDRPDGKKKDRKDLPFVSVWKNITVREFAEILGQKTDNLLEILTFIPNAGNLTRASNQIDDIQVLKEVVKKLEFRLNMVPPPHLQTPEKEKCVDVTSMPVRKGDLAPRPPVVTIMGHVDHGKTTLLDALRNSNIVASEAGGITQAIGAFQVKLDDKLVTFIDTPGHAAFSAMRNRGANATDIVVLVVAADDGVMEQTQESIRMAKDANVPIIVAINKIDRGGADIERTKNMLLQEGIQLEEFGGEVMSVPISALKSINLTALVETILTQAELMQLKSESKGMIEGVILESRVDVGRGKLCSGIVQRGMLRKSAIIVAGTAWAKVRGIFDENNQVLTNAGPSSPVEIIGWREMPSAGDKIFEVESELRAKEIVDYRNAKSMEEKQKEDMGAIKEKAAIWDVEYREKLALKRKLGYRRLRPTGPREKELKPDTSGIPKLNLVVKGDVDGSVESFLDVIDSYDCENQCRLDVVHYGIGDVTESDIKLAQTFQAHVYGFNIKMSPKLEEECVRAGIEFRQSKIIYRLVESLKKDIEEILPTIPSEDIVGEANVQQLFVVTEGKKKLPVAGSRCIKGTMRKDCRYKLVRGEEVLYDGLIYSMRLLKKEVSTIAKDVECGLCLDNFEIMPQEGDTIICYKILQNKQKTAWSPVGF